ncbi:MAG: Rho termination factor N-terminal domain-containing protein [Gaiellaceae bacterium]
MAVIARGELEQSPLADLHAIASELGIEGFRRMRKEELIDTILGAQGGDGGAEDAPAAKAAAAAEADEDREDVPEPRPEERRGRQTRRSPRGDRDRNRDRDRDRDRDREPEREAEPEEPRSGILDILPNGSGFMRADAFAHSRDDVYVSPAQIRRCELRSGDQIEGPVRAPRRNERHPSLVRVDKVNGSEAEPPADRPRFEQLTPVFARDRLKAPDGLDSVPFGRGSRVAVGGPPGAGVTTLLRRVVLTLRAEHPEIDVTVVLAGVRPEEVTEWKRDSEVRVAGGGFDRSVDEQAQAADMAVERSKRAVETGGHAAIVVDSLDALPPAVARRVFGAARNTEEGGSLTVVAATGLAGEPQRVATTRIVLEPGDDGQAKIAPVSGTLRADLLGAG